MANFWGRYDIRGVVGEGFDEATYLRIGRAFAQYVKLHADTAALAASPWIAVGHDARPSAIGLSEALIRGIIESGLNVVRLGLSTSPMVYFSEYMDTLNPGFPPVLGAVSVTASHNPPQYNGAKFTFQKTSFNDHDLMSLKALYEAENFETVPDSAYGQVKDFNQIADYTAWFEKQFSTPGRNLKVVVDSANATAGIVAPDVLRRLGCDVIELFSEPDGTFPNHHPDPCVPKNLETLVETVLKTGADVGIAFDGDADRLGVVDEQGQIFPGDMLMLFYADALLEIMPGAKIIFDIKCTQTLFDFVNARHGEPLMGPSGHALMKNQMKQLDSQLGGEFSGHVFFRDRHWGFDDALYAACRLIEVLGKRKAQNAEYHLSQFRDSLPKTIVSDEIRVACKKEAGQALIHDLEKTLRDNPTYFGPPIQQILTMDGLRAGFDQGFILIRGSNTEPCITLRYEADSPELFDSIGKKLKAIYETLSQPV